jgi:pre-mRNA-splicing helicase BRR2
MKKKLARSLCKAKSQKACDYNSVKDRSASPISAEMPPKGGAEAQAQARRFEYNANSNLVLTTDAKPRDSSEPSGEPQSLAGRVDTRRMGDRFAPQAPDRPSRKRPAEGEKQPPSATAKHARPNAGSHSVLDVSSDFYTPKTPETRAAYESLLSAVQRQFGDQPEPVLRGAADEVLTSLKNEHITDPERRRELQHLLGSLSEPDFARLVSLGKLITDFSHPNQTSQLSGAQGNDTFDDEIGVAVEFDENDEEDADDGGGGMGDVVQGEGEEEEDDTAAPQQPETEGNAEAANGDALSEQPTEEVRGMQVDDDMTAGPDDGADPNIVRVADIDAYWLQRQVSKAFNFSDSEAERARELADKVFSTLETASSQREAENELVLLLNYEKFDLIKLLLTNRTRIVWCVKLARAESKEQRENVEERLAQDHEGTQILRTLQASRGTARERQSRVERNVRQEAKKLREQTGNRRGKTTDAEAAAAGRRLLELENLTFSQGSHLMSNRRCELPSGSYRTAKKGYEEVHVPAQKPQPLASDERFVEVSEMPEWVQPAFEKMQRLNRVQSRMYETALFSPENILLCAPTGSGKTNVALLAIMHEIAKNMREDGTVDLDNFKVVYVAPMKALVSEMVDNFSNRLQHFGINVYYSILSS